MKKLITFFAALVLVLTSCSNGENPQGNNDKLSPTQNPVTDLRSEPDTKKQVPEFRIDGELPEIGEFSGKTKRFYEEYTPDFIPSDEYGKIVPYVGSYKIFSNGETEYEMKMGYSTYGFCTEDGRIVMDASAKNNYISYTATNDGFGFYTLSIIDNRDLQVEDDVFLPQRTLIIPETGTWCIELGQRAWLSEAGNGIISVSSYTDPYGVGECIIYDYDGNEISRIGNYDNVILSDSGLIGVMRWSWSEDGDEPFHGFLDVDGNVVLGPYLSINPFNNKGVTYVEDEEGWHLIDTTGKKLTDKAYESISLYKKDYNIDEPAIFAARPKGDRYQSDIFTSDGKYLTTIEGVSYFSVRFPDNGEILYCYSKSDGHEMVWKRLSDHSDFVSKELGKSPNQHSGNDNVYVYREDITDYNPGADRTGYIIDANGDTIVKIEDFRDLWQVSSDGKYLIYCCGDYTEYYDEENQQWLTKADSITTYLYSVEEKKSTKLFSGDGSASFTGKNEQYIIAFYSENLTVFGNFDNYLLYDVKNDKVMFDDSRLITYSDAGENGYITVCTEHSCTLYDGNLNLILTTYNE